MIQLNEDLNLDLILKEFESFLDTKKSISDISLRRYTDDIRFYFYNVLKEKKKVTSFLHFFNYDYIEEFYQIRSGSTAYTAVNQLVDSMENNQRITKEQSLSIKYEIASLRKTPPSKDLQFISKEKVSKLFSDSIIYTFTGRKKMDYSPYKNIAPLIWSLSYDCGFEQKHILNLKLSDVSLENYQIRNLRSDKNDFLSNWINMSARVFNYLQKYLSTRDARCPFSELIIFNNRPVIMETINTTFNILKRKENLTKFEQSISAELLVRSGIANSLIESNGSTLTQHIHIHGTESNGQLIHGIEFYLKELNANTTDTTATI